MKILTLFLCLVISFMFLISCTAGPNAYEKTPNDEGKVAGF